MVIDRMKLLRRKLDHLKNLRRTAHHAGVSRVVMKLTARHIQRNLKTESTENLLCLEDDDIKNDFYERLRGLILQPQPLAGRLYNSQNQKVIMVVGHHGVGKSTVCCQLAKYYDSVLNKKPAIICASGGNTSYNQLTKMVTSYDIFSRTDVPDNQAYQIALDGLGYHERKRERKEADAVEVIIVDTMGAYCPNRESLVWLRDIASCVKPYDIFLVVSGRHDGELYAVAQALEFKKSLDLKQYNVGLTGIIASNMDGDRKGAIIYNVAAAVKCPLMFVSTGPGLADITCSIGSSLLDKLF